MYGSPLKAKLPRLLPERHQNRDFFVANILDCAPKDDTATMEHPIFALSMNRDVRERRYEHNGTSVVIAPSTFGLATIWDKDVLIYLISQMMEGMNRGREDAASRVVRFTVHDYLVSTNKGTGGDHYRRLEAGLDRLKGTTIKTDIRTGGVRIKQAFGLIDEWRIIERSASDERMIACEVTLSEWVYNAVKAREVLTISRDYFRLRGGLERRLYELARKHCGNQARWKIGLDLLHKKSGSLGNLREFRRTIKTIAEADVLPDYRLSIQDDIDQAFFVSRDPKKLLDAFVLSG